MANRRYPHEVAVLVVLIFRDVACLATGDDQLTKLRAPYPTPNVRALVEHRDRRDDDFNLMLGEGSVEGFIETKDTVEVIERTVSEGDHEIFRAFGRAALVPLARARRYAKTSSAGMPLPERFIAARRFSASA